MELHRAMDRVCLYKSEVRSGSFLLFRRKGVAGRHGEGGEQSGATANGSIHSASRSHMHGILLWKGYQYALANGYRLQYLAVGKKCKLEYLSI